MPEIEKETRRSSEISGWSIGQVRGGVIAPPAADYVPLAIRRIKEAAELQQKRMEFWVLLALIGGFMAGHFMTIFALMEPVR